jgi:hypothetical protein
VQAAALPTTVGPPSWRTAWAQRTPWFLLAALALLVPAIRAEVAWQPSSAGAQRSEAADGALRASLAGEVMDGLLKEEWELEQRLAQALGRTGRTSAAPPELLELEQALRHVRAMQVWQKQHLEAPAGPQ